MLDKDEFDAGILRDFRLRGMGILQQQRLGAHQHSRRTESALYRMVIQKSLLEGGQFSVPGETLHRVDRPSRQLSRQEQAGIHRIAVHYHGTRAALPNAAALLGARQLQPIPQEIQKGHVRLRLQGDGFVI